MLSNGLYSRFDNRLYRVNGAFLQLHDRRSQTSAFLQVGLQKGKLDSRTLIRLLFSATARLINNSVKCIRLLAVKTKLFKRKADSPRHCGTEMRCMLDARGLTATSVLLSGTKMGLKLSSRLLPPSLS